MAGSFTLADNARVRYVTGSMMYFAQGIPMGLLSIAIPVWLASQGVSAGDIGSYLAVIVLPWAFKLITGPLMDRYEFLPMGRRRPWVIGAQLGLSLSLLALLYIERPTEQIGTLMLIGVLINIFAATQDVAVDGMSIDLTPVREQGRLNAFMSFGKAIGWASTAAVSGVLLTTLGLATTAIIAAAVSAMAICSHAFRQRARGRANAALEQGKGGRNTSRRFLFQSGVQRDQQSPLGENQSDRHGHHVLRWSDIRLWPGINAYRSRQSLRLHHTAMVATRCHDGIDRRRPRTRGRPRHRQNGREAHAVVSNRPARHTCLPDRPDTAPVAKHALCTK